MKKISKSNTSRKKTAQSIGEKRKSFSIAAKHLRAFCVNSILTTGVKTIWRHSCYATKGAWFLFPVLPQIIKKFGHDVGTVWTASAQHHTTWPNNVGRMLDWANVGTVWTASAQHHTTWPNNVGWMLEQMLGPLVTMVTPPLFQIFTCVFSLL